MGYEDPVQMPTMDIYSTDLMKAYIAGVKDQYERGQEEYKDFMKAYSDFYSPIAADNEYYYNNTIGGANKLINDMYANGIDPFKSPEARAAISRYIASRPTGTLANIRRTADAAKEYQKNYGEMLANGATTPEYERWRLQNKYGMSDIANWNTATMGALNETAPGAYRSAFDMVSPLLKDLDDTLLTKEDVEKMGYKYDPFYEYSGISPTQVEGVIGGNLGQLMNTPQMQYAYAQHKAAMEASSNSSVSGEDAMKSFLSGLVMGSAKKHLKQTEDYRAKAQYDAALDIATAEKKEQIAYNYDQLRWNDPNNPNSIQNKNNKNNGGERSHFGGLAQDWATKLVDNYGGSTTDDAFTLQQKAILAAVDKDGNVNRKKLFSSLLVDDSADTLYKIITGKNQQEGAKIKLTDASIDKLYTEAEVFTDMYGMKTTYKSSNGGYIRQASRNRQQPGNKHYSTMTPKNGMLSYVSKTGTFKRMKPVTVRYYDAESKSEKTVTMYRHLTDVDLKYVKDEGWIPKNNTAYTTMDNKLNFGKESTSKPDYNN